MIASQAIDAGSIPATRTSIKLSDFCPTDSAARSACDTLLILKIGLDLVKKKAVASPQPLIARVFNVILLTL